MRLETNSMHEDKGIHYLMHVDVRVTESDFQVFNLGLFHFGRGEWSNFPLGILSPLPDDFTVVSTLRRPPVK